MTSKSPTKTTKYEECKKEIMDMIMKEYEQGKLKNAKSRKQAIAIGLSMSERKCKSKIGINDYKNIEENIENRKLSVALVKDSVLLYNYYKKNKQYKKASNLKDNITKKVLEDTYNKNKVNKIMVKSLLEFF